jgi:uncharacterized protein (DUF58 family)
MENSQPRRNESELRRATASARPSRRRASWLAFVARRFRRSPKRRPRRRSRTALVGGGWCYLLVLAFVLTAATLRQMNLMLVLVGMLIGPLLFNWRLVVVTLRGLEVRRKMPHRVCAGDLIVVGVELANTRRRIGSWAVRVQEHFQAEAGPARTDRADGRREQPTGGRSAGRARGDRADAVDGSDPTGRGTPNVQPTAFFLYVPAGQSRKAVYRGRLPQRGRYRLGPVQISTRFPFGLFERRITLDRTDTLTVFPRLGRLARGWVTRPHEAFEGTQRRERRHSRITGDFYGVREWRDGDSRRWIHWRSSARHGRLVVRQFEQQRNRDVALLLDLWQPSPSTAEDLQNVELAVSFAATVAAELCRKGGSSLLVAVTGPEPECIGGPASVALLQDTMERLAVAEASSEDRLPALLERALRQTNPGAQVVLVSTRANDLSDRERFATLREDPARRALARRIRTVNVAGGELADYFQV